MPSNRRSRILLATWIECGKVRDGSPGKVTGTMIFVIAAGAGVAISIPTGVATENPVIILGGLALGILVGLFGAILLKEGNNG